MRNVKNKLCTQFPFNPTRWVVLQDRETRFETIRRIPSIRGWVLRICLPNHGCTHFAE